MSSPSSPLADILGSQVGVPLLAALPQFGAGTVPDDLVAASPNVQSLLSSVGGAKGLANVNALAAGNPQMAALMALLGPAGGINPAQAAQFGPIFSLMLALQQGNQKQGGM